MSRLRQQPPAQRTRPPRGRSGATLAPLSMLLVLGLVGCSAARVSVPDLSATLRPTGFETIRYPADGVALAVPRDWTIAPERAPLVAIYSSGPATIALWRFPRRSPAVLAGERLNRALAALIRAAQARDRTFKVQKTGVSRVSGAGAVIIDALEHVNHALRRVRSEHIYVAGAELVLDAYAPPAQFPSVDHVVFSPVRSSLSLIRRGTARAGLVSTRTSARGTPNSGAAAP